MEHTLSGCLDVTHFIRMPMQLDQGVIAYHAPASRYPLAYLRTLTQLFPTCTEFGGYGG